MGVHHEGTHRRCRRDIGLQSPLESDRASGGTGHCGRVSRHRQAGGSHAVVVPGARQAVPGGRPRRSVVPDLHHRRQRPCGASRHRLANCLPQLHWLSAGGVAFAQPALPGNPMRPGARWRRACDCGPQRQSGHRDRADCQRRLLPRGPGLRVDTADLRAPGHHRRICRTIDRPGRAPSRRGSAATRDGGRSADRSSRDQYASRRGSRKRHRAGHACLAAADTRRRR